MNYDDRTISASEVEAAEKLHRHVVAVAAQEAMAEIQPFREARKSNLQRGHKPGAYLGGVRDLGGIRDRCFIDEDTGCWRWRLAKKGGVGRVWMVLPDGSRVHMVGRRAAMQLKTGIELPKSKCVFAKPCCPHRDCVNPAHSRVGTRKEAMQAAVALGLFDTEARRRATEIALRAHRKLSPQQHREIAVSDTPAKVLAASLGISTGRINAIRRGDFGARSTNSVFNL